MSKDKSLFEKFCENLLDSDPDIDYKNCLYCHKRFKSRRDFDLYCSYECYLAFQEKNNRRVRKNNKRKRKIKKKE